MKHHHHQNSALTIYKHNHVYDKDSYSEYTEPERDIDREDELIDQIEAAEE